MWKPHNLHAEVEALLPETYWAAPTAPADEADVYLIAVHVHVHRHRSLNSRPVFRSRPVFQLRIVEVMHPDRFDTFRHIRGRLTTVGHLDWHDFPTLEAAIASLTTQHRLGVGNA